MKKSVIIVAAGSGSRMKEDIPKQFIPLLGIPVLMHTIRCFYNYDPQAELVVSLSRSYQEYWKELCYKHHFDLPHVIATGGETRFHTVRNSLAVAVQGELIAIHDGVRPLVSHETLDRCFLMAAEKGSAIPCIPVSDSVRMKKENDSIPVDRELYRLIQTPQVFRREILEKAFQQNYQAAFTDDASVVERAGYPVFLVDGNPENIKITTRVDLAIAGALLNNKFD